MIIELDTSLLKKINNISLNQFVFLSLVLDNNQKQNQNILTIIRLVSDNEIQDLVERNLIQENSSKKYLKYEATETLLDLINPCKALFDQFYNTYPILVVRPDGSKGFLRGNTKKCRDYYNKLVKNNLILHDRIIKALNYEISVKTMTGKLGYMKTMWKWLTSHEWDLIEEEMHEEALMYTQYGTELR